MHLRESKKSNLGNFYWAGDGWKVGEVKFRRLTCLLRTKTKMVISFSGKKSTPLEKILATPMTHPHR